MSGAIWLVSYLALSLLVVVLGLAVLHLYREVGTSRVLRGRWAVGWPSEAIRAGSALPALQANDAKTWSPSGPLAFHARENVLVVFSTPTAKLSYAAAASAMRVAQELDFDFLLVVESSGLSEVPEWVAHIPTDDRHRAVALTPREFRNMRFTYAPATALVTDGTVRDLMAGLFTPTDILREFAAFLPHAGVRFTASLESGYDLESHL